MSNARRVSLTSAPWLFLRRSLAASLVLVPLAACSSDAATDDDSGQEDDRIVNLPSTPAKDQRETGNCWLYATAAWAESLSADTATGATKSYSTAYLIYWNFFEQILGSDGSFTGVDWTGGSFHGAQDLMQRYGLMTLNNFTVSNSGQADANLSLDAQRLINASLRSGNLRTAAARKNRALVRKELNAAFKLSELVTTSMDTAFGPEAKINFTTGAKPYRVVLAPSAITVRLPADPIGSVAKTTTLDKLLGQRAGNGTDPEWRTGPLAWTSFYPTYDQPVTTAATLRTVLKRVQRALHAGVPVPVGYCAEPEGMTNDFDFGKQLSGIQEGNCGHETLIVDYEAQLPDGRILKAGQPASAADMQAALSDKARILFLRVKNSWGADATHADGHSDLSFGYLSSSIRACPDRDASSPECVSYPVMIDELSVPPGY